LPPGYVTEASLRKFLAARLPTPAELSFDQLEREGYVLVGSARTVTQRLQEIQKRLGFGVFIVSGRTGDMPREKALKTQELFAREVMPHFRSRGHEMS